MIERFHDFYGCHASIVRKLNKTYDLYIRMGKWSDCWVKSFQ